MEKTYQKKRLSFWDIWNMSFGFLGIQFGFALQIGNTSRIFQTLNANVDDLAIYWLAGPVTGLIVQPIIGYMSDRTWMPNLGRRKPYFLIGAILASISLIIMPNSGVLWIAIGMLWIMDSAFNITMEPFRAFVGDNLPNEQRTMGFAMQSFFIGIGAVVASALPWILSNWFHINNTAPEGIIPTSVKWSFYIGAVVFLLAVLWTVIRSKEYPPEEFARFSDESKNENIVASRESSKSSFYSILLALGILGLALVYFRDLSRDLYVLGGMFTLFGLFGILAQFFKKEGNNGAFVTIMEDLKNMPSTMKQLALVQFFAWFALFAMWIYTTPAITANFYGTEDASSKAYNEGADWVNILFAVYNGVAALVAFLLPVLAKQIGRRKTHLIALILGGLGLISINFFDDVNLLVVSMIGVGIAWASILSMPYAMLTGSLPQDKLGYYMGVFNFFIVIPQLVAASILGFILKTFFSSTAIYALLVGGIAMIIAGFMNLLVNSTAEE